MRLAKNLERGVIVGFLVLVGAIALSPTNNADFFIIRATGEWIINNSAIPRIDPFAFTTQGTGWIEHKWFFDVLIYVLCQLGDWAPIIFKVLCVLGIYSLLVAQVQGTLGRTLISLLFILLVIALRGRISERPHLMGELLLVAMAFTIKRYPVPSSLWGKGTGYLFIIQLLWANVHGSFILGPILLGLHGLGHFINNRQATPYLKLFGGLILVSCLNPYGPKIFLSPWNHLFLGHQLEHRLAEWQPLAWSDIHWSLGLVLTLMLGGFLAYLNRQKAERFCQLDWRQVLLFFFFLLLGCRSERFIMSAGLILLPWLPQWFKLKELAKSSPWVWLQLAALLSMALVVAPWVQQNLSNKIFVVQSTGMPVGAASYLKKYELKGNLFHSFDYGSYLAATLFPNFKIFIDGRLDLYPQPVVKAYYRLIKDESQWKNSPYTDKFDAIVFHYDDSTNLAGEFLKRRLASRDWALVYLEEKSALLLKRTAQNQPLINKDELKKLLPTLDFSYLKELAAKPNAFKETLAEINRLKLTNPNFVLPYLIEGQLKEYSPRPIIRARACDSYEQAWQINHEPQIQFILAACLGDRFELTRALNHFRDLSNFPQFHEKALVNQGLCYAKLGLYNEASRVWQETIRHYPNNREAKNYLHLLTR